MKKIFFAFMLMILSINMINAQGPNGKNFGFGINIGDPLGLTGKFWLGRENAITVYVGGSYFGNPRIGADYVWHFNAFNSNIAELYAGPGLHIGFGKGKAYIFEVNKNKFYYRSSGAGFAVRGIFGLNVTPRNTPLEIYVEMGPLIGISPDFGSAFEAAIGFRFYP
ncbi:MAG: hypothetical protein HYS25_14830 [Ignavibacteriales bacterium]|nr:hypothetical protein [Ignavibacteriales bacterium]